MPADQHGHPYPKLAFDPAELRIPPRVAKCTYQATRTPGEFLITYDDSANKDWTDLNSDLLKLQRETMRQYRAVFPIGSAGLIGEWPRPGGLETATAWPILFGMPVTNREQIVEFRNKSWKLGVSMVDILLKKPECLEGAEDIVLEKYQGKELIFVMTWLGYKEQAFAIRTRLENGDPVTRRDLAVQITTAYGIFFKKVDNEGILPAKLGFYNIALHQGINAREDSLGIQFAQLHLVRFYNTTANYFVAEVDII